MRASVGIAWPGGSAKPGETVNPAVIPELTRARWIAEGALTPETKIERERWGVAGQVGAARPNGLVPFTDLQMTLFIQTSQRTELRTADLVVANIPQMLTVPLDTVLEVLAAMIANGLLTSPARGRWRTSTAVTPMLTMMRTLAGVRA